MPHKKPLLYSYRDLRTGRVVARAMPREQALAAVAAHRARTIGARYVGWVTR